MVSFFNHKNQVTVSPSIVIFTVAFLLGLYFLFFIRSILTLLFLAFIIMVALNPAVSRLEAKLRLPRIAATFLVYLLVIAVIVTVFAIVVPPMTQELYQLFKNLHLPPVIAQEIDNFTFTLENFTSIVDRVGTSVNVIFSVISSTFSGLFTFFTLFVLSFYLMLERKNLYKKISWFSREPAHLLTAKQFVDSLEYQLGGWVRGQLILMILIGSISYVALMLLNVPYALPLAVLAGFLEIVPNLGPTIAAVPAVILAYANLGPVMAGITAVVYIVVQQLENNIIVPKIMKDSVDVDPLVAIITILVGLKIGGVMGALLAVPAYIVVRTLYSLWYRRQAPPNS